MPRDERRDSQFEIEELRRDAQRLQRPKAGPPRPELRSAPAHEVTEHGVAPPRPGSAPLPPPAPARSLSPPSFASPLEEAAIEREALSEGARVVRPPESFQGPERAREVVSVVRHEYGLDKGTRTTIRAIVALVLGALGLGGYAAVKPAPEAPPVIPVACEVECPTGKLQQADTQLPPDKLHARIHCCEIVTALRNSEEALGEAKKARELAGKASDKATLVEGAVPRIEGVKPQP